jgi:hypothetical protein
MNSRSFLFLPFGFATDGNIQNFSQANRRAATVEACAASPVAATADQDRKKAEVVINAIAVLRMTTAR